MSLHRATIATGALLTACAAARAQAYTTQATIQHTLAWQDDGNHNGLLEPGEAAIIRLTATVTPAIDTVIQYTQGLNTLTGTLRGLASSSLDIYSSNSLGGEIRYQRIDPVWDATGLLPYIDGTNQAFLLFGQLPSSNEEINTTNPLVNVFEFLWVPSTYQTRTVSFQPAATAGDPPYCSVYIVTGPATRVFAGCPGLYSGGRVDIPVVPASSGALLVPAIVLLALRRRR